jgi:hypothetical protein
MLEKPSRRFPIAPIDPQSPWPHRPRSFAVFLSSKLNKPDLDLGDAQAGVAGICQAIRFGGPESQLLLEALGDLLCYSSDKAKPVATRLAARAYLRAGYVRNSPGIRNGYITLAEWALVHRQADRDDYKDQKDAMHILSRQFTEIEDADAWRAEMASKENELIATSANPEEEINRLYGESPRVPDDPDDSLWGANSGQLYQTVAIGLAGLIIVVLAIVFARRVFRRKANKEVA